MKRPNRRPRTGISRRTFLRVTGVGATALALRLGRQTALASSSATAAATPNPYVPRPAAAQYVLAVASTKLNPDGKQVVTGITANGTFPGPEIRVRRGEQVRIRVENGLDDDATSIHWHGLLVPAAMDGVPDVSNAPIASRGIYVYEFPILQSGTYWYHSHWRLQEQIGLAGAFIIEEADRTSHADHDAVVMLSDWLHGSPYQAFDGLRSDKPTERTSGSPQKAEMPMAMPNTMTTPGAMPSGSNAAKMAMPTRGGMQMGATGADLSDVQYDAFLLNGKSTSDPWILTARPGERIRLRLINAGASTYFRVRLDGHPLQITHADGMAVEPVVVDHLLMGMAECYDAVVSLSGSGSYTLHAVAQDGSGQAVGVLRTPDATAAPNLAMPKFDGRALSYAALRAAAATTLPDGPTRSYRLPLQGDMARYVWMIDGQAYPKADPLPIRVGERVEVEMRNETMMWHPMHLHGHFFRLLQGAGERSPLKHTVNVAPRETVKIEFIADNPGRWIFHCHNLYHFEAGMARVFEYVV